MIRPSQSTDLPAILAILRDSAEFDQDSLLHIQQTLTNHLAGADNSIWLSADDGEPMAVAYCAPEPVAAGTWNLLMIWVRSDRRGSGHGGALITRLEQMLRERKARLLLVETSGLPSFASARQFYLRYGFVQEATIRDFYADGEDKIVFSKSQLD